MSVDYTRGVVGRDPVAKGIIAGLIERHPDWSDEQVADWINRQCESPVIDEAEVAYWRAEVAR